MEQGESHANFSRDRWVTRFARLEELLRPTALWPQVCSILANGTADDEPPTYGQVLAQAHHVGELAQRENVGLRCQVATLLHAQREAHVAYRCELWTAANATLRGEGWWLLQPFHPQEPEGYTAVGRVDGHPCCFWWGRRGALLSVAENLGSEADEAGFTQARGRLGWCLTASSEPDPGPSRDAGTLRSLVEAAVAEWRKRDDVRSVLVAVVLRERLRSAEGELAAQEQRVKELDAGVKGPPGAAWVARAHAGFYRERCEELRALLGDVTEPTSCGGATR